MSQSLRVAAFAALFVAIGAPAAMARNDVVEVTLTYVEEAADDSNVLDNVSWHLVGTDHPKVAKRLEPIQTKASTNAAFKRDEDACARAFLSAIINLQTTAVAKGANGLIEIRSIARGKVSEEPDRFVCNVGNVVAHVSLTAVPVVFEEE